MSVQGRMSRRQFLRNLAVSSLGLAAVAPFIAACQPAAPQVIKETVIVEKPVEKIVEKPVEKIVEKTVVVTKIVEKEAAPTPKPALKPGELKPVPRNRTLMVMGGESVRMTMHENQNPYIPGSGSGFHTGTLPACWEQLIMFNVLTGEYENWLAEDWSYNADFTEITIKVRKGVKWNDGQPFTAKDIVFTYNLCRDNKKWMTHLADWPEFGKEAVLLDDFTCKLVLNKPNPAFWCTTMATNHGIHVLPEHIWKGQDPQAFTNHDIAKGWPVGTGPYRMVAATPDQKVYDRRDDWWAVETGFKKLPKVERIIYVPSQEESKAALAIITNQVDMCTILQVPTLKSVFAQNPRVVTFSGQQPPYGYLDWCPVEMGFNCSQKPYDDKDIRWAINYCIDREKLVQLAEGGAGVIAMHQFTPYKWFKPFDEALKPIFAKYNYDTKPHLDKSAELMQKKGYKKDGEGFWVGADGKRFAMNIHVPSWLSSYGPPLAQQLRDGGFDASFDMTPALDGLVQTGEQSPFFNCKGPSGVLGMDPYFMLAIYTAQYFRPTKEPAPIWWATSRWQNAEYDEIVKQVAPLKPTDPKTLELFLKAMEIWVREMPDIYVAQLIIRFPMNTTYWVGWPSDAAPYGFPHSWQWELQKTFLNLEPTQ